MTKTRLAFTILLALPGIPLGCWLPGAARDCGDRGDVNVDADVQGVDLQVAGFVDPNAVSAADCDNVCLVVAGGEGKGATDPRDCKFVPAGTSDTGGSDSGGADTGDDLGRVVGHITCTAFVYPLCA